MSYDLINGEGMDEVLEYAWLELGDIRKVKYVNPLLGNEWTEKSMVPNLIVQMCRNPDYLHFFCKYILNLDLAPYQNACLKQLWTHPLAMMIASRGGAKSFMLAVYSVARMVITQGCSIAVVGAGLRQSMVIYDYINKIWDDAPILRDICGGVHQRPKKQIHMATWEVGHSKMSFMPLGTGEKIRGQRASIVLSDEFGCVGPTTLVETKAGLYRIKDLVENQFDCELLVGEDTYVRPEKFIRTPAVDVYEVKAEGGFKFRCSSIHQVLTVDGFKLAKDLTKDDRLVYQNHYQFPEEYIKIDDLVLDEDLAWAMGLMVAEGSVTDKYCVQVHMTDTECLNRYISKLNRVVPHINIGKHHREAYKDKRGWDCKSSISAYWANLEFREKLVKLGINRVTSHDKIVPWSILRSPKSVVKAFLQGLFEGDGSAFKYKDRQNTRVGVSYYTVSEQLSSEVQVLLSKLGFFATRTSRVSKISENPQWMVRLNNRQAEKFIEYIGIDKWNEFINISDEYNDNNKNSNLDKTELRVRDVKLLPEKEVLYDFDVPPQHQFMGGGLIHHNSINEEIFETVVRGFASVKSKGTFGGIVDAYKEDVLKDLGVNVPLIKGPQEIKGNQIIICGTASYHFNHFYKYYKTYKAIIESGGNKEYLRQEFPDQKLPENLDAKDYLIIQLPYNALPKGMMDIKILEQGKATMDPSIFMMEYGACFAADSVGFYLASWINGATSPVTKKDGSVIEFYPALSSKDDVISVMGIDPASEDDNFAITIAELHDDSRRIVYTWTTNHKAFEELRRNKLIDESIKDYQTFCIKHIRDLVRRFNVRLICLDASGGGLSIREGLRDPDKVPPGELPIFDLDDENLRYEKGLHILKMIEFSSYEWRRESHYGLRADLMNRILCFPGYDAASIEVESSMDSAQFDTLQECHEEIEEGKVETMLIRHSQTPTGNEKWDVPSIMGISDEKARKRLKRDRFTSILLANWAGRIFADTTQPKYASSDFYTSVRRGQTNYSAKVGNPIALNTTTGKDGRKIFY